MTHESLITRLNENLEKFGYRYDVKILIPHIVFLTYIETPKLFKVKNLIAVLEMPKEITDTLTSKRFFDFIKQSLLDQYGEAFLWKELEICLIVICESNQYHQFHADDGAAVMSQASFSMNAMMGATFIDIGTWEHFTASTWGLYFSGDHLKAVDREVGQWCASQKELNKPK